MDVKKAFILMVHKQAKQINLFINQLLDEGESSVYVHVNKLCEDIKKEIIKHERVFISNNNIEISWGKDNILRAQLLMLKEVLSHDKYDYIFFQTGQDLLIKSGLDEYLTNNKGTVFIDCIPDDLGRRVFLLRKWPTYMCKLLDKKYDPIRIARRIRMELLLRGFPIGKKKVEYDVEHIKFYKNYVWFSIPIDVAEYIIDFLEKNPGYWSIYKDALIPEEAFWSTTIMNSPFANRIHFIDGEGKSLVYIRKFINNHPPTFTMNDIKELESSGAFFARKFDISVDSKVVDYFYSHIAR